MTSADLSIDLSARTEQLIQTARQLWAFEDAPVTLIAARENHVYRVDTSQGPVVLRIHRPGYRSNDEIRSELQWMQMLAENNIAVPRPIKAIDGSLIQSIDGVVIDVLSWLHGKPLSHSPPSKKIHFKLGQLLYQMHDLADAWQQPIDFVRPTWDLVGDNPTWDRFWENPRLSKQQAETLLQFRDHASNVLVTRNDLDFGLVHADLVSDNVLYDDTQLKPIDFDDGGFGYRLFDLATITLRCQREPNGDVLAEATMRGYSMKREIDADMLKLFEALRACTYVGWNISRMDEPNGLKRNPMYIGEAERAIERYYGSFG